MKTSLDAFRPVASSLLLAFLVAGCSGGARESGDEDVSAADAPEGDVEGVDAWSSDVEVVDSRDAALTDDIPSAETDPGSDSSADLGGDPGPDGDTDAGGPTGDPVTFDEYAAQLPGALCAFYARCAPELAATKCTEGNRYSDTFRDVTDATLELERALIALGTVAYHADLAGQCLGGYATAPCQVQNPLGDVKLRPPAECSLAFEGLVAKNGSCWRDEECASPSEFYCAGSTCVGTGQARGKCAARPGVDGACAPPECAPGLTCVRGYCPFVSCPSGGSCRETVTVQEGESCGGQRVCAEGLACPQAAGICQKPAPVGSICDSSTGPYCDLETDICLWGAAATDPRLPMQAACVAFGTGTEGDPCGPATCGPGLVCAFDGENPSSEVCMKGGVPFGSPCHSWYYHSDCADGAYCGLASGASVATCMARNAEGVACEMQSNVSGCMAGLRCLEGYWGKCSAGGKFGDTCKNAFDCRSSLTCGSGNKCLPEWACDGG